MNLISGGNMLKVHILTYLVFSSSNEYLYVCTRISCLKYENKANQNVVIFVTRNVEVRSE